MLNDPYFTFVIQFSHEFVNEILCVFPSSGVNFLKVAGFCLVKRWKDGHLLIGVEKND
jgi:hypothetical protein